MSDVLLTPKGVMARLGLKKSTFHKLQARGFFKQAEAVRPIGTRRYVAARIDAWAAGESPTELGRKRSA